MRCKGCGRELQNEERFCSRCGTMVGNNETTVTGKEQLFAKIQKAEVRLGECKKDYLLVLILLTVSAILVSREMFTLRYRFLIEVEKAYTMFEGTDIIKIVFILGYVAGIGLLLLPFVHNTRIERTNFCLAIGLPLASMVWMLGTVLVSMHQIEKMTGYGFFALADAVGLHVTLSVNAWALIVSSIWTLAAVWRLNEELWKMNWKLLDEKVE